MELNAIIPNLALFTLIAVVVIAVVGYLLFKRKSANRHPMDKSPDGAIATVRDTPAEPAPKTILSTDEQARDPAPRP